MKTKEIEFDIAESYFKKLPSSKQICCINPKFIKIDSSRNCLLKPTFWLAIEDNKFLLHSFYLNYHKKFDFYDIESAYGYGGRLSWLNLKGKEQRLAVPQNIDILSEFLGQGYKLPHSCREAMCGSCAAKLVEGQVEMKENYALNYAKLGEGYVLLCQSTPVSDRVILEYVR